MVDIAIPSLLCFRSLKLGVIDSVYLCVGLIAETLPS